MPLPHIAKVAKLHTRGLISSRRSAFRAFCGYRACIGIVPRIVVTSLFARFLAVAGTQAWTTQKLAEQKENEALASLRVNLGMLRELLRPLGAEWRVEGDQLSHPVPGRHPRRDQCAASGRHARGRHSAGVRRRL